MYVSKCIYSTNGNYNASHKGNSMRHEPLNSVGSVLHSKNNRPEAGDVVKQIGPDHFQNWRQVSQARENIESGKAHYNDPYPVPPARNTLQVIYYSVIGNCSTGRRMPPLKRVYQRVSFGRVHGLKKISPSRICEIQSLMRNCL